MAETAKGKELKHLVRVANTDLIGHKKLLFAMRKIKGVSYIFANAICNSVNINPFIRAGELSDQEAQRLDEAIKNPQKFGIPSWLYNRRGDPETGEDHHVILGNLQFNNENDIKKMKKMKCYKGVRHIFNLPARGQNTRSNFRRNKGKVTGVKKAKKKSGK